MLLAVYVFSKFWFVDKLVSERSEFSPKNVPLRCSMAVVQMEHFVWNIWCMLDKQKRNCCYYCSCLLIFCFKNIFKGAEATWPKILAKNSITLFFFYSNFYLTFQRSCCENIFKIVCIVSEKIGKYISEFPILFFSLIRSCLQFHWNRKYFTSAVLRLRGRLFMAPWHGFHLFDEER